MTTTVMIAHIAFSPTCLKRGFKRYRSETKTKEIPTLMQWIIFLVSWPPLCTCLCLGLEEVMETQWTSFFPRWEIMGGSWNWNVLFSFDERIIFSSPFVMAITCVDSIFVFTLSVPFPFPSRNFISHSLGETLFGQISNLYYGI